MIEFGASVTREGVVRSKVHLAADDGLDAPLGARFALGAACGDGFQIPRRTAKHVTVVRDGTGRHAQFKGALCHILQAGNAVLDGILGMVVQVDECHGAPPAYGLKLVHVFVFSQNSIFRAPAPAVLPPASGRTEPRAGEPAPMEFYGRLQRG